MAPVCSSWTRISRGTSWRTAVNVFGNLNAEFVVLANLMISRWGVELQITNQVLGPKSEQIEQHVHHSAGW